MWLNGGVNLPTAAERLGVHYQTAYRWVRQGSLPATKQRGAHEITEAAVERVRTARSTATPPPAVGKVRNWPAQAARLHTALLGGDEMAARALVDRLRHVGIGPLDIIEGMFVPALHRIGEDWAADRISVATEHRATAMCERLVARVAVHPRGRPRGVVVVATPPGEAHALPAAMAAVALRADRWQVHHLGPQVPTPDLVHMAAGVRAALVVLSVTFPQSKAEAEAAAETLAGSGRRVLVGQPGMSLGALVSQARCQAPNTAWAAAKRAIGTRNGEQLT
jgi:MerR family transcriptional regulator, light-induced transcriptional regulator